MRAGRALLAALSRLVPSPRSPSPRMRPAGCGIGRQVGSVLEGVSVAGVLRCRSFPAVRAGARPSSPATGPLNPYPFRHPSRDCWPSPRSEPRESKTRASTDRSDLEWLGIPTFASPGPHVFGHLGRNGNKDARAGRSTGPWLLRRHPCLRPAPPTSITGVARVYGRRELHQ